MIRISGHLLFISERIVVIIPNKGSIINVLETKGEKAQPTPFIWNCHIIRGKIMIIRRSLLFFIFDATLKAHYFFLYFMIHMCLTLSRFNLNCIKILFK